MNVPFLSHSVINSSVLKNVSQSPALFHFSCFGAQEHVLCERPLGTRFQKLCLCDSYRVRVCLWDFFHPSSFQIFMARHIDREQTLWCHSRPTEGVCVCGLPTWSHCLSHLAWCLHSSVSKQQLSVTDLCTHPPPPSFFCSKAHFVLVHGLIKLPGVCHLWARGLSSLLWMIVYCLWSHVLYMNNKKKIVIF